MERLFDDLPGGYANLIMQRRVGFPAVHVTADFKAPIRYGDTAQIAATVTKLGTTSCALAFVFTRASDGITIATTSHVHVCTSLSTMTKLAIPDDVRATLAKHLVA
jgi:4-hydroxybenzoyl-CoA thioesterase